VDWWVDERRDPGRSTNAAVRFIRALRDQFGSLYLAAAAYNGGPGRIARGMARYADDVSSAESDDPFFVLAEKDYLKNETRDYVPQLIAAALIAKEPGRYGMELHPMAAYAYDSVYVPASTPLSAVARASATDMRTVLELNPHFLRGMTPPREASMVRIPVGASSSFDSSFAALPRAERAATHLVETKKGDTPDRIAQQGDIGVAALRAFNPGAKVLKSGRYAVGQTLTVPEPGVAAAIHFVPDPAIERYGKSAGHSSTHMVARGESLSGIARKYGTTSDRLMKLNGLRKPVIFPGQSLIVAATKGTAKKGTVKPKTVAKGKAETKKGGTKKAATKKAATKKAPSSRKAPSTKSRKKS
jgi:membrane-bound lytic murein transglycosylase D